MKLTAYLEAQKETAADFATRADMSPSTVSRLCSGERKPSVDMALRIKTLTQGAVDLPDWKAPKNRPKAS